MLLEVSSLHTKIPMVQLMNQGMMGSRISNDLDKLSTAFIDKMFKGICENLEKTSEFIEEVKYLECQAQKLVSES